MGKFVSSNLTGEFALKSNPYQQAFLRALMARSATTGHALYRRLGIFAGRRGGKTHIGAVAAALKAGASKTHGWCIAPTYLDLHDYVIPAVARVIPRAWIPKDGWSAEFSTLRLVNGSLVGFRSADDPERMRGQGLHWAWMDEVRKIRKLAYDTLEPSLTEHRGQWWGTTSPNGYDWAYKEFYRRAKVNTPGYWACRYKTTDNPTIPREEIEAKRATMDPQWFKQEYEAEFVRFEGSIYGDTIDGCIYEIDDVERIKAALPWYPTPDPSWPLMVGIDPGADHPFAAIAILVTPQGLVPWIEYRKRMSAYADHAENLRAMMSGFTDARIGMDRTQTQGFIELAQHGVTASAAENSVLLGIQRVQTWLRSRKVFLLRARTPMLIEEMEGYHYKGDPSDEERITEKVFKMDDDLCDAFRYGVMLWPELPVAPVPIIGRDPNTVPDEARWAWERMRRIEARENGTDGESDWGSALTPLGDFFGNERSDDDGMDGLGW